MVLDDTLLGKEKTPAQLTAEFTC